MQQYTEQMQQSKQPLLFPLADQQCREERAAALHGRLLVKQKATGPLVGQNAVQCVCIYQFGKHAIQSNLDAR
jgi:hypothetical protein